MKGKKAKAKEKRLQKGVKSVRIGSNTHTQIWHGKDTFDALLGQILFPTSIIFYLSFHV
jgi:hypothetical protein